MTINDDQDEALKIDAGEEASAEISPIEEPKATGEVEEPVVETESTEEVETEGEPTETEDTQKKGYSNRVRELVKERNEAKAQAKSLSERLAELTGSVEPNFDTSQIFKPTVEPGEISPEQYQQDVLRTADSLVNLRIKQSEAVTKVNNDARDAVKDYPQLDPNSELFDEELSNSITEATEGYIAKNPFNANVKQFVDKLMRPYTRAVNKEVGKQTENIAKQVSQTALRPTSVRQPEKTAKEMSIEELEAQLGVTVS